MARAAGGYHTYIASRVVNGNYGVSSGVLSETRARACVVRCTCNVTIYYIHISIAGAGPADGTTRRLPPAHPRRYPIGHRAPPPVLVAMYDMPYQRERERERPGGEEQRTDKDE